MRKRQMRYSEILIHISLGSLLAEERPLHDFCLYLIKFRQKPKVGSYHMIGEKKRTQVYEKKTRRIK